MNIEAMKQALENIVRVPTLTHGVLVILSDVEKVIEQAQEPEQLAKLGWQQIDCPICGGGARAFPKTEQAQPVAYIRVSKTGNAMACAKSEEFYKLPDQTLLYTAPHPRKPLTDNQIESIAKNFALNNPTTPLYFARAIEAAHGIKL